MNTFETQINELLNTIGEIRHLDYGRVMTLAQEVHQLALVNNHTGYISRSLSWFAWGELHTDQREIALIHALEAYQMAVDTNLKYEEGLASNVVALCYGAYHDYSLQLYYLLRHKELGEQLEQPDFISNALNYIGLLYIESGDYQQGIDNLLNSLMYLSIDDADEHMEHALTYYNICNAFLDSGQYETAIIYGNKALEITQRHQSLDWIVRTRSLMGTVYLKLKQYDHAKEMITQAIELTNDNCMVDTLCMAHEALGHYEKLQENFDAAIECFEYILTQLGKDEIEWILQVTKYIANIYEELDDYQKALHYHKISGDLQREFSQMGFANQLTSAFSTFDISKQLEQYRQRSQQLQQEIEEHKRSEDDRLRRELLQIIHQKDYDLARVKQQILVRIGHEFRTPLSVIQTSAQILQLYADKLTTESKQRHFDNIQSKVGHIDQLLKDILVALQIQTYDMPYQGMEADTHTTCQQAIGSIYQTIDTPRPIIFSIEDDVCIFSIHQPTLHTILVQLLSNAIKYSQNDIRLCLYLQDNQLYMDVIDKGMGVPEGELSAILQPLQRGSNVNDIGGNGLGLTIVSNCVELYDGSIDIQSTLNKGTQVTVRLPQLTFSPNV